MRKIFSWSAVVLAVPVVALADGTAVQAKIGTLGLGVEVAHEFSEHVGARAGLNTFDYSFDAVRSDIDYEFDLGLKSVSALVDFRPAANGFRLTAGALANGNAIDAEAKSNNSYTIGGTTYDLGDVGSLTGNVEFDGFAPYLGLGWNSPYNSRTPFGVSVDIGVVFQGSPQVDLSATGLIADDPTFITDLEAEENSLQSELDGFEYYPVLAVGMQYRF